MADPLTTTAASALTELIKEEKQNIYNDLIKGSATNVGKALSNITSIFNTVTKPIKYLDDISDIYFGKRLESFAAKISGIPKNEIIAVPPEIGIPILEKIAITSNEEIANGYVELLVKSSWEKTIKLVHPSFLTILTNLASDEAKILQYLFKNNVPVLSIDTFLCFSDFYTQWEPLSRTEIDRNTIFQFIPERTLRGEFQPLVKDLNNLPGHVKLDFPSNDTFYLERLIKEGLLEKESGYPVKWKDKYCEVIDGNEEFVDFIWGHFEKHEKRFLSHSKYYYHLSFFGKMFVKAINELENKS